MERLTKKNKCKLSNGEEIVICKHSENDCNDSCMKIIPCKWYTKAIEKLKHYEDLEEQLNKVYGDCDGLLESMIELLEEHSGVDIPDDTVKALLLINGSVDFYKKCESLEEQGRLIKLPCKVGDTVWKVEERLEHIYIERLVIDRIEVNDNYIYYFANEKITGESVIWDNCDFSKTVFLTKSEAEAKLKELRGGENKSSN